MPLRKYFKGKGQRVMRDMKDRYGEKDGESAFYATANARNMAPEETKPRKRLADRIREG